MTSQPIDSLAAKRPSDGSFGRRLVGLREAKGLTQADLAAKLAVSKVSLWKWEKNKSYPRAVRLAQIAETLGTTLAQLTYQSKELSDLPDLSSISFGDRLSIIRKKRRVTLEKAGEAVGVTGACIWYWQRNIGQPDPVQLKGLAEILNVSLSLLAHGRAED